MIQSERLRPRGFAAVAFAVFLSLMSFAMPAAQTRGASHPGGGVPPDKAASVTKIPKEKGETPAKQEAGKEQPDKPAGAAPSTETDPCDNINPAKERTAGMRVKLYYFRDAAKLAAILTEVKKPKGSDLKCLVIQAASQDEVVLYGPKENRDYARRIIAALDLPRPGIDLEMWGIQISSSDPEKMAVLLPAIRDEINRTQRAVRELYNQMQRLAQGIDVDQDFKGQIEGTLAFTSALDANRSLSFTDILLRLVAAKNPARSAHEMATALTGQYRKTAASLNEEHKEALEKFPGPRKSQNANQSQTAGNEEKKLAFENFFRTRGLSYAKDKQRNTIEWEDPSTSVEQHALMARLALLDFGLHYGDLVHYPRDFSPYYLQQSAETLNSRLQTAIDALNVDMQAMFVEPTLLRIQELVRSVPEVKYAQVGKTSVASLSGTSTEVTSHSVSAFEVTPPLTLSELLTRAKAIADSAANFIPKEIKPGASSATELTTGALPISQVIGLIGALGEERSVWRQLQSGISLTITPNVLRNMTSAELQIDLKTGDPLAGSNEQGVRPLSRVSQHEVKTSVYVNALDFFDLSAFISQSSLDGGRGYVPLIGPIWRNLFSEVPGIGGLFSWKRPPQTVYHQSLVLTNSFITPTAMAIALLYPTDHPRDECALDSSQAPIKLTERDPAKKAIEYEFKCRGAKINQYRNSVRERLHAIQLTQKPH